MRAAVAFDGAYRRDGGIWLTGMEERRDASGQGPVPLNGAKSAGCEAGKKMMPAATVNGCGGHRRDRRGGKASRVLQRP